MALNDTIVFDDWSAGWVPDLPEEILPKNAQTRLENADVRNRFLQTIPGVTQQFTDLPAGVVVKSYGQFKFTIPTEQDVDIVYGTLSGVHKLYAKPYLSLAGAWVDAWQDLTEYEGTNTADATTNTTTVVDSALLSSTDDYYNKWIFFNITRSTGAIITGYVGSTKTLTLSNAIASQTSGDTYFIMRNNIFDVTFGSPATLKNNFAPSSAGVRFHYRENAIDIVTGSDYPQDMDDSNRKADFWLGVVNSYQAFDDTDLNYTGLWLTFKVPAIYEPVASFTLSEQALAAGDQALAVSSTGYYIVLLTVVYDGFQESPINPGYAAATDISLPPDGTRYDSVYVLAFITASRKLRVALTIPYVPVSGLTQPVETTIFKKSAISDTYRGHLVFDRRITAFRIYIAEANTLSGSTYYPASEFRRVGEVRVNEAAWTPGATPVYAQDFDITGDKYTAAAGIDITEYLGHESFRTQVNADFITSARGRVYVGSVYADQQRLDFLFKSPTNSDGINTPNTFPFTSTVDLSLYGVTKITGLTEAQGFIVAFGSNRIIRVNGDTGETDLQFQQRGSISDDGYSNINQLLYFTSSEDIYFYHAAQEIVRSIADGKIREEWKALADADKQASCVGYDQRYNFLVIAAGSTIYVYNLPRPVADTLIADTQAEGAWWVYDVDKTFVRFVTDLSGACIGITSAGEVYELFSSGVANSMVAEFGVAQGAIAVSAIRLVYESTSTVTIKIFDLEKSSTYPAKTYRFKTQSGHFEKDIYEGIQVERLKVRVEASLGAKISKLVLNPVKVESK